MRTVWMRWVAGLLALGAEGLAGEVTRVPSVDPARKSARLQLPARGAHRARRHAAVGPSLWADAADPGSAVTALAPARGLIGALDLELNSPGGETEEAMRLGRWLRRNRGGATVKSGELCASACVLVLAGAVRRTTPGAVVVHRPYLGSATPAQARQAWLDLDASIRRYLARMNVPVGLADLALEEPPDGGRVLTRKEKRRFLLDGWDPAAEEEQIATLARLYGVTSGEYRRRWQATQTLCGSEDLLERQIFTLDLNPGAPDRAEKMRSAWRDCRWKAMGEP